MSRSSDKNIKIISSSQEEQYSHHSQEGEIYCVNQFQKTNQIFLLNSKINQLNLIIQKMSIQHHLKITKQQEFYDQIEERNRQIEIQYHQISQECEKRSTIAEAERTAKEIISKQFKQVKKELTQIRSIFGFTEKDNHEFILKEIENVLRKSKDLQLNIQNIKTELANTHEKSKQRNIQTKEQNDKIIKRLHDQYNLKIKQIQSEKYEYIKQIQKKSSKIEQYTQKMDRYEKNQSDYYQLMKKIQQERKLHLAKQQELASLKMKQEQLNISLLKYQQSSVYSEQKVQQLTLKLGLANKKTQIQQNQLRQEQQKNRKLEGIISSLKQQHRQTEQAILNGQQIAHQLKQKLNSSSIYKEKYKNCLSSIKQLEERNRQFSNMAQQYARQIQILQEQLYFEQEQKGSCQQKIKQQQMIIQSNNKQIIKLNLTITHQNELLKQLKLDLSKNKQELESLIKQSSRKKSFISLVNQSHSEPSSQISNSQREQWQRMNQQIVHHYQNLLESQDKSRLQLQQHIHSINSQNCQLRSQFSQLQKQISELKQQNQLTKQQNQRLLQSLSNIQKAYEKKITQLRSKFKEIQYSTINNKQQISSLLKLKNHRSHLNISNCYSFCQNSENAKKEMSQKETIKQLQTHQSYTQVPMAENTLQKKTGNYRILNKHSSEDHFSDTIKCTSQWSNRANELQESIKLYKQRNNTIKMKYKN